MPEWCPRIVLAGHSRADRKRRRAGIRLRDYTITSRTKARYEAAVSRILPHLENQSSLVDLDGILVDWIEYQWAAGESLGVIGDTLSGLHFYWPDLRGHIRQSWRMFRSWRRVESPVRAPPLTIQLAQAFVGKAVHQGDIALATLIALGFHALLRTGELLSLRFKDLEISHQCGVLSLHQSKTGLRTGAQEAVALRDSLTLQLVDTLRVLRKPFPGDLLWPHSGQAFRNAFQKLSAFFKIEELKFKPYSLRRGGATYLLQVGVPLETILVRGRWRSIAVARLYLEDGLAQIPALRASNTTQRLISRWVASTPATAFHP